MSVASVPLVAILIAGSLAIPSASTALAQETSFAPRLTEQATSPPAVGVARPNGDEDSDNARNPALTSGEGGAGQETGGPARNRIPE